MPRRSALRTKALLNYCFSGGMTAGYIVSKPERLRSSVESVVDLILQLVKFST